VYGNAVRVYFSRPNNLKQSDASFPAAFVDGRYMPESTKSIAVKISDL
jgi:hypothetical protein